MKPTPADLIATQCAVFERLFDACEIARMVTQFYDEDGVVEGRGLPPVKGHAAITRLFADARADYRSIRIMPDPPTIEDHVAFGTFTNRNVLNDGTIEVHRGIMVWVRRGLVWQVRHDFFFAEDASATGHARWHRSLIGAHPL